MFILRENHSSGEMEITRSMDACNKLMVKLL